MREFDPLEKFISDNRDHFEEHTTSPLSWEKISTQLDQNVDRERSPGVLWVLKRAAAAVIIVFAMYGAYNVLLKFAQNNTVAKHEAPQNIILNEFSETEAFYVSRVQNKFAELEKIAVEHPQILMEVQEEFKMLDSDMKTLKKDLSEGVASQEIIEAMVQNYRIKLKIVENILEQMKVSNNDNNKDDEERRMEI